MTQTPPPLTDGHEDAGDHHHGGSIIYFPRVPYVLYQRTRPQRTSTAQVDLTEVEDEASHDAPVEINVAESDEDTE